MKKRTFALALALSLLCGLLALPAQAAGERSFHPTLQEMVNESQEISSLAPGAFDYEYPEGGYGALYDLNGDGIQELLTVHWRPDDLGGDLAALYATLFTLSDSGTPALAVRERLFGLSGMSNGFAGVVQKDGQVYFCTFSEEGDNELFVQRCQLYELSGTTALLAELSYIQYQGGEVTDCTLNGRAVSPSECEAWMGRIGEVLILSPNSANAKGLSALLRQIDSLPEDTQAPSGPVQTTPDTQQPVQVPTAHSGMDNFTQLYSYYDGLFWDVERDDWFQEYAARAYELGLMNGTGNGSFDPRSNMTIAQAITLAARIHSIYYTGSDQVPAVASGQWYAPYVLYALKNGIPTGFSDMQAPATREQFAYILSAALPAQELPALPSKPWAIDFFDYNSCAYTDAIDLLTRAGILQGIPAEYGGFRFEPNGLIDRASAAAIVTRMADPALRQ